MDLVVNNTNDFAGIFKNNGKALNKSNYLRVALHGDAKNSTGIGSKVKVFCKGHEYYLEQFPVRGFQSSVDQVLHFGLGNNTIIDSVIVIWPGDQMQKILNVKVNQTLNLKLADATGKLVYDTTGKSTQTYLTPAAPPSGMQHRENNFNDFNLQPLLTNFLSKTGPCMAAADVNKDGLQDIFFWWRPQPVGAIVYTNQITENLFLRPSQRL